MEKYDANQAASAIERKRQERLSQRHLTTLGTVYGKVFQIRPGWPYGCTLYVQILANLARYTEVTVIFLK